LAKFLTNKLRYLTLRHYIEINQWKEGWTIYSFGYCNYTLSKDERAFENISDGKVGRIGKVSFKKNLSWINWIV